MAGAVRRGLVGGGGMALGPHRDMAASEPILNQHVPHRPRGTWVPFNKSNPGGYEIPRTYLPFYELARVRPATITILAI